MQEWRYSSHVAVMPRDLSEKMMNDPIRAAMMERPYDVANEASASAVSWAPVIAGAFVAPAFIVPIVLLYR
jgi:hypothetical protein